jgi:hypothetical protein
LDRKAAKKSKEERIVASVLVAGLIFSPIFLGQSHVAQALAETAGKTEKVLLIASEKLVQVAPDDPLHQGGIKYNAMVFNGTVPGPIISDTMR